MSVLPRRRSLGRPMVDRQAEFGRSPALVIVEGALGNGAGRARARLVGPDGPVLAVLFGINLLVVGILQLVAAFSDAARRNGRGLSCMLGTLSLLVGLLCLRDPLQTLLVLGQSASPCFRHGYLGPGCFRRRYGLGWR
jgi:uncharacterized membrane protein HdeD (DUF308 family)